MDTTLNILLGLAMGDAVLHTLAGPDHYLPFVMIARSRGYSTLRALGWTFVCGIGHVGSALIIALLFMYASNLISETDMEWLNENRGNLAAWALIGFGAAYFIYALRRNWLSHHHGHEHGHNLLGTQNKNITPWIIFIIFVLGPLRGSLTHPGAGGGPWKRSCRSRYDRIQHLHDRDDDDRCGARYQGSFTSAV